MDEDGGGALLAVKLSRLTARLDELQEQNEALTADKASLSEQVAALQQVGLPHAACIDSISCIQCWALE
jgi:cell division protein FtsB